MTTIVTRAGKGNTLTHSEVDANFTNLNNDKLEATEIGVTIQPYSAVLDEYAAVNPTSAGLALLDDADAAAQRTTLGVVIGTDVQAHDALLDSLAGQTVAANKIQAYSAADTASLLDFKDEDNMASDSATAVPSQQSVKAYVTTQIAAIPAAGISLISTSTLTAASDTGDITVAPGYRYKVIFRLKQNATTAGELRLRFNNDTGGSSYSWDGTNNASLISLSNGTTVPNAGVIQGSFEFETIQGDDTGVIVTELSSIRGNAATYTYSAHPQYAARWDGSASLSSMKLSTSAGDITGTVKLYRYGN